MSDKDKRNHAEEFLFFALTKKLCSLVTMVSVLCFLLPVAPAGAHSFTAFPDYSTVQAGEQAFINFTLSEPFPTPDLSLYGMDHSLNANLVYESGRKVSISGFSFYNTENPSDTNGENSDVQRASVAVAEGGAAYIAATLRMNVPHDPPLPFVGFAKSALNIAPGAGKNAVGDDDVLELVPVSDLFSISKDQPFEVKVLFKGQPLPGATVSAAWAGMPLAADGEQAWAVSAVADGQGIASVTPDRASLWLLSAGHYDTDGVAYGGTLLLYVNAPAEERERVTTDLFMPQSNNEAGLFFADFIEGAIPEADAFLSKNNLRWAGYVAVGNGSSQIYREGKNQLEGNSGADFTIPTTAAAGVSAMTGFGGVYTFAPDNLGESLYKDMEEKLNASGVTPTGGMIVLHPREIFPNLGLRILQVYDDGTERDVTEDVVEAGFDVSRMSEGEITAWWGALVADRDVSGSHFIPITLSSVGEDGKILFDGKADGKIESIFYIAGSANDDKSSDGSGCSAGMAGAGSFGFLLLGLILTRRNPCRQAGK
ncbi:MAG: DUF4198 domain-containing protein [Synergistaceae bacterium]|nr:DUF4198 domain-containing protein [Synergistaceae bacterium]